LNSLIELKEIADENITFKDSYHYISDSFNANLVCSYNHENKLNNIDSIYDLSNKRVSSIIKKEFEVLR